MSSQPDDGSERNLLGRLCRLDGAITLQMELPPAKAFEPPLGLAIREVGRAELPGLATERAFSPGTLSELDAIAPTRWRCYAAFEGERPVHYSFVAYRDQGPELFRVTTQPAQRRRAIFRAVVTAIARSLSAEHEQVLRSKVGLGNAISLNAHLAAGFSIVHRRYDPVLFDVNLRIAGSKIWRRLRGRSR